MPRSRMLQEQIEQIAAPENEEKRRSRAARELECFVPMYTVNIVTGAVTLDRRDEVVPWLGRREA